MTIKDKIIKRNNRLNIHTEIAKVELVYVLEDLIFNYNPIIFVV